MDQFVGKMFECLGIMKVCWESLAEGLVRIVFNSSYQQSFDGIPGVVGDMESEWPIHGYSEMQ